MNDDRGLFWGCGVDEAPAPEHPGGSCSPTGPPRSELELRVDGLGAGVEPLLGQLLAQQHDSVLDLGPKAVGEVFGRRDRGTRPASSSLR